MSRGPFHAIRSEGGLLPPDLLSRIAQQEDALPGMAAADYHLQGERLRDAVNRSWGRLLGSWRALQEGLAKLPTDDRATTLTRERWLLPLFQELGYGRLPKAAGFEARGRAFAISHVWNRTPIHLLGWRVEIDRRQKGVAGAAGAAPHGMVQHFLNLSEDHLWGFVSNGRVLRLLRDNSTLTRQSYVEFDLETMFTEDRYSEFAVLWLVCHQSRVECERPDGCWLEKWSTCAHEEGGRALEKLREGVEKAIAALGGGFLRHRANGQLQAALTEGRLTTEDYYRQLLRLAYRLIFLLVAEARDALLDPGAPEAARDRYRRHYSIDRLRTLAGRRRGGPHGDLWRALRLVMGKLDEGCPDLALPALGTFLWRADALPDLDSAELANEDLLTALRELAYTQDRSLRRAVNWRDMGSEELGSVYEALLELHPRIHRETGTFDLGSVAGSERKLSGSYYTPDSLVQCLLDSALEPVLDEAVAGKDTASAEQALLDLKVCDPACGSGHFLVAAARRIARRLAGVRSGEEEPSPPDLQRALREVVGRCLYGVDLNPMALELCKVSFWMEAVVPGRPLSFLDAHLRCGNSLLGATPSMITEGVPDDAFKPLEGDDRAVVKEYKARNARERIEARGQLALTFDGPDGDVLEAVVGEARRIDNLPEETAEALRKKEMSLASLENGPQWQGLRAQADTWCSAFSCVKNATRTPPPITTGQVAQAGEASMPLPAETVAAVRDLASSYRYLHWHLAFPTVMGQGPGLPGQGFDLIVGNPPWDVVEASSPDTSSRQHAVLKAWLGRGWYDVLRGRRDLYKAFMVLATRITRRKGRVAFVVPVGAFLEEDSAGLRQWLFSAGSMPRLRHFQNVRKSFFPSVHASYRFVCFDWIAEAGRTHRIATVCGSPHDLDKSGWLSFERHDLEAELGPSMATLVVPHQTYAVLHQRVLRDLRNRPGLPVAVVAEFHASSDIDVISERQDNGAFGILKNKAIHQYNPHFDAPERFVAQQVVAERVVRKKLPMYLSEKGAARLLFRDIARNDDARTVICCVTTDAVVSSYDTPMMWPPHGVNASIDNTLWFMCGWFNSFIADFLYRPFVDKHIKGYTLSRVPVPDPDRMMCGTVVAELARSVSVGKEGGRGSYVYDDPRRVERLADLEVALARDLTIARADMEVVLDSFPVQRREEERRFGEFRLGAAILQRMDT